MRAFVDTIEQGATRGGGGRRKVKIPLKNEKNIDFPAAKKKERKKVCLPDNL